MSLPWAEFLSYWGNWVLVAALLVGVAATYAVVVSGNVKEAHLKLELAARGSDAANTELRVSILDAQRRLLEKDIASANERAAKLDKEAADARLETERLRAALAWRALAPNKLPLLETSLSSHTATAQLEYVRGDPESQRFAAQIWTAFRRAGWKVVLKAKLPLGAADGIWVLPNATPGSSTTAAVECVRAAFQEIGLPFNSSGGPAMDNSIGEIWGPHSPPVKIIVGSKPEPRVVP